jgi:hypothetical protein
MIEFLDEDLIWNDLDENERIILIDKRIESLIKVGIEIVRVQNVTIPKPELSKECIKEIVEEGDEVDMYSMMENIPDDEESDIFKKRMEMEKERVNKDIEQKKSVKFNIMTD